MVAKNSNMDTGNLHLHLDSKQNRLVCCQSTCHGRLHKTEDKSTFESQKFEKIKSELPSHR